MMKRSTQCCFICLLSLHIMLCGVGYCEEPTNPLKSMLAKVLTIQWDLAIAEKRFSVTSRGLADSERCAARELLGASISFRGDTEAARQIGLIVGEMKSSDDERTARRYLGIAAYRVVSVSEADIQIVDECLGKLTTPMAITQATAIRESMKELRDVLRAYASKNQSKPLGIRSPPY
jgi:hypothetical protein